MTGGPDDLAFMRAALALARRGLGQVAPNPAVGCVIAKGGRILGRGWTQPGGRPHAEAVALEEAGEEARGANVYVTLEPCSHQGETPPCAEALIRAQVARCFIALEDPDPRVKGGGAAKLRDAGIEVVTGLMTEEAARLNEGYLLHRRDGRPLVSLKLATTLDGRIATDSGESRWITGELARAAGHRLRATHDAVMVGGGTARSDNPRLDCRLPGLEQRTPLRVVMDGSLSLPLTHDLVASASKRPTLLITRKGQDSSRLRAYLDSGIEVETLESSARGMIDVTAAMKLLAGRGITRVLVEGGGQMAASLMRADLVDRLYWFRAAKVIGAEGRPGLGGLSLGSLKEAPRFRLDFVRHVGEDLLERYSRKT
jgi:diaminohydroxyphosphoribosylaminopyrimidine deaminase / 5-amino-6-(5-phosphoribosylamino)uracil reductase